MVTGGLAPSVTVQLEPAGILPTDAELPADTLPFVEKPPAGAAPPVQLTLKGKLRAGSGLGPPVTVLLTVKVPGLALRALAMLAANAPPGAMTPEGFVICSAPQV